MVRDRSTVVRTAEDGTIVETIAFAVAAARDVNPTDLDTPLYDVVDADALEGLVASAGRGAGQGDLRVQFAWAGCDVVVEGTGRVVATTSAPQVGASGAIAD